VLERGAFQIEIFGEGELSLPKDETNAIIGAVRDGYAAIFPNEGAGLSHFLTLRHD
jgi:homoserine kinase